MSAYEDAKSAAKRAAHDWDSDQWAHNYGSGSDVGDIVDIALDTFLAALPPSIVVDGKVVELDAQRLGVDDMHRAYLRDYIASVLHAAREVAE